MTDLARVEAALEARAGVFGRPCRVFATTESTNDEAKRAAREGAPHGLLFLAEAQTRGRGRQGRAWMSEPGMGLLFSVVARLACPPARLPPLALVCGLAVRDAVARAAPEAQVRLKWPNDVVTGKARHKVAGILLETAGEALVIGIGLNVHAREFPEDIAARTTSVALLLGERPADRVSLLIDVLDGLERDLPLVAARGLAPLASRLAAADALRGERVRDEGSGEGLAEGIDADGRLLVRRDDGTLVRFSAGEVHLVDA